MLTKPQQLALLHLFQRSPDGSPSFLAFRRRVLPPIFAAEPYIIIHWHGMWIGIEPDGYTHS